ncbi:glycosyltransferase family 4 protein [Telmatocola sphagniphila]|uniref:Glycosyltransferase family 4 protein n=1 Tax=Telmatocola sphagniphila TaxID=1123043 RepID=A0A8E6EWG6_9BACT|nr:glycosyltransferase family 4 protein [Telmatocola sphagniphila]QVL33772.1 glycosyltransferase family 4 protein [Telmatocola sphagniphila]
MSRYVTAFAGRRDGYQIPWALEEADRLEALVTTFYSKGLIQKLGQFSSQVQRGLRARQCPGVPNSKVSSSLRLELVEHLGRRLKIHPPKYWNYISRALSRRAGKIAERTQSNLLLYEPYAWEAFQRNYTKHNPAKILFHFHVHPDLERQILDEDTRQFPPATAWQKVDGEGDALDQKAGASWAWTLADQIFCASRFTRRTLLHAGASAEKCQVVPYGVDAPAEPPAGSPSQNFRALFLGSGIQRKGLHHLLRAWSNARLPAGSELRIVSRVLDPAMKDLLNSSSGIRFYPGVSAAELVRLFQEAHLLVVPSLIEGFGAVFLEAAAKARAVLGTENTCVPDLGTEADGFFTCPAGDPGALAQKLTELSQQLRDQPQLGMQAWKIARKHPWQAFRTALVERLP